MRTTQSVLRDIKENPEKHMHRDMNELSECAFIDGAINMAVYQAHEGLHGRNGGVGCDVAEGPCSCGAWH